MSVYVFLCHPPTNSFSFPPVLLRLALPPHAHVLQIVIATHSQSVAAVRGFHASLEHIALALDLGDSLLLPHFSIELDRHQFVDQKNVVGNRNDSFLELLA